MNSYWPWMAQIARTREGAGDLPHPAKKAAARRARSPSRSRLTSANKEHAEELMCLSALSAESAIDSPSLLERRKPIVPAEG